MVASLRYEDGNDDDDDLFILRREIITQVYTEIVWGSLACPRDL